MSSAPLVGTDIFGLSALVAGLRIRLLAGPAAHDSGTTRAEREQSSAGEATNDASEQASNLLPKTKAGRATANQRCSKRVEGGCPRPPKAWAATQAFTFLWQTLRETAGG